MAAHGAALRLRFIILSLIFVAGASGQKAPCQNQTKGKVRGAPVYRVGDSWRSEKEPPTQALQISINSRRFNRKGMTALARQLNDDFCREPKLAIYIFDSYSSAQTFSILPHSPTYKRDFEAFHGFYFLDRNAGKEYIEFSRARRRLRDEVRIEFNAP